MKVLKLIDRNGIEFLRISLPLEGPDFFLEWEYGWRVDLKMVYLVEVKKKPDPPAP